MNLEKFTNELSLYSTVLNCRRKKGVEVLSQTFKMGVKVGVGVVEQNKMTLRNFENSMHLVFALSRILRSLVYICFH